MKTENLADLRPIKTRYGIPAALEACHTALVGGYVVEGHVPADLIVRLLRERPRVTASPSRACPPDRRAWRRRAARRSHTRSSASTRTGSGGVRDPVRWASFGGSMMTPTRERLRLGPWSGASACTGSVPGDFWTGVARARGLGLHVIWVILLMAAPALGAGHWFSGAGSAHRQTVVFMVIALAGPQPTDTPATMEKSQLRPPPSTDRDGGPCGPFGTPARPGSRGAHTVPPVPAPPDLGRGSCVCPDTSYDCC